MLWLYLTGKILIVYREFSKKQQRHSVYCISLRNQRENEKDLELVVLDSVNVSSASMQICCYILEKLSPLFMLFT